MKENIFTVTSLEEGKRLDIFLMEFSQRENLGISRTFIQKNISSGLVSVDNVPVTKPHIKVKDGQVVRLTYENKKEATPLAEDLQMDVLYEDADLAVINKQPGMVVHPAPGNYEHTLVNALLYRLDKLSDVNPLRPGIVHRLDKDTSGILLVAKNNTSHHGLDKQFAEHTIKRKYVAVVKGRVGFIEDIIELPIGRHPQKRKNMSVFGKNTKYAKTFYRTLKRAEKYSLMELEPFTGRTHQLRVHLAYIGHPILGDNKYGKNNAFTRLALHAQYIGFIHPATGKFLEFSTPTPKEFLDVFPPVGGHLPNTS